MNKKELVPKGGEYVLQHNAISRSIYSMSTTARRLVAMAMSYLPMDGSNYKVEFTVKEYMESIGLTKGTKQIIDLINAVRECISSFIEIQRPNGSLSVYTWFSEATLQVLLPNPDDDSINDIPFRLSEEPEIFQNFARIYNTIEMEFNPKLGAALQEFKKAYAKIDLANLGALTSRYAIRYYEIAMSEAGFKGKNGNKAGEWYFEYTIPELRTLFALPGEKYPRTGDFRIYCIDNPIEDLNAANIGLYITPEYIRKGKYLAGVKFLCRETRRDERPANEDTTDTAKLGERLRKKYPEAAEKFEHDIKAQGGLWDNFSPASQEVAVRGKVTDALIKFDKAETKKKRAEARELKKQQQNQ